jgi:multidrug transporter EmrE-like cation transporter
MISFLKSIFSSWGLIFLSALLDSYAAFIVKTQFNRLGKLDYHSWKGFTQYLLGFVESPLLITALIAFISAPGLWFLALNRIDLSVGYPILVGFHLLFILIFGIVFLHEGLDWYKITGTILIFVSLYFFYRSE